MQIATGSMEKVFDELNRNTITASQEELLLPVFGNKMAKKLSRLYDLLVREVRSRTDAQKQEILQILQDLNEVVNPYQDRFPVLAKWLADRLEAQQREYVESGDRETEAATVLSPALPQLMTVEEIQKLRTGTARVRSVESVLANDLAGAWSGPVSDPEPAPSPVAEPIAESAVAGGAYEAFSSADQPAADSGGCDSGSCDSGTSSGE